MVLAVEGERRGAVDRDAVVVVADDQLAQGEVARDRGRFLADALHQVAVRADHVDVVVDQLVPGAVEALREEALGHRHPHRVGEALPQRPRRDLDALRVAALGVPRRERAPLAELLQILEAQLVAAQVKQRVLQHARVTGAQHEAVAVGPLRVRGVRVQEAPEDRVPQRRQRHRRARVAGVRLLHGVHRQAADRVDRESLYLRLRRGHSSILEAAPRATPPPGSSSRPRGSHQAITRCAGGAGGRADTQPNAAVRTHTSVCAGAPAPANESRDGSASGDTASVHAASAASAAPRSSAISSL